MPTTTKPEVPLNFLLGCSDQTLANYRLARMGEAADLRKEIQRLLDRLREVDLLVQLALWFEENDRRALRRALETEEDASVWAKRMIRGGHDILPRLKMSEEEVREHRRESSKRYQKKNVSAGLCRVCGKSVCRESAHYCSAHLGMVRDRARAKSLGKVPRGKHPNSIAALAQAHKQQTIKRKRERGSTQ